MSDNISLATSVGTSSECNVEPSENIIKLYKNHTPNNDRPMYRKDILYAGSVPKLPQYNNNIGESTRLLLSLGLGDSTTCLFIYVIKLVSF